MKTLGIKLADGSFYPIMEEGTAQHKQLVLTTANNNQTKVMVDLYRSANCNMDDAEYVDSLQIDNLVEHPNGEVSIQFDVSLDENNQLTAYIVDSETGRRSDTELPLITRTLEERQLTDEYNIKEIQKDNPKNEKKHAAGVGLLAMANAIKNKSENSEKNFTEEKKDDDFSENSSANENLTEEIPDDEILEENQTDIFEEPDKITDEETDNQQEDQTSSAEETISFDEPISSQDDIFSEENNLENPTNDDFFNNLDLDDSFGDSDSSDFENSTTDDIFSEENSNKPNIFEEPDKIIDEETDNQQENQTSSAEETISFDEAISSQDDIFSEENNLENPTNDDFFNNLDLDDSFGDSDSSDFENSNNSFESDFDDENKIANSGISFTGLYDKETENGNSASSEDDDTKKKTKIPVIICIICAIICVLATIFVLFIIPSKLNVLKKNLSSEPKTVIEETVKIPEEKTSPEEPEQIPEEIPPAKEDEIVIVEKAEEVIPEVPEPAPQKPENIIYKIKWGDTLWDIADTYYKNPWKYKYIAKYNNIKNPDYIISGTEITIPAE